MANEPDTPTDGTDGIDKVDVLRIKDLITKLHTDLASLDDRAMKAFARHINRNEVENLATFLSEVLGLNRRNNQTPHA